MSSTKKIYLDHAATTPMDEEVLRAMEPFFSEHFGNPSSLYGIGLDAKRAIEHSRQIIADFLSTTPDTVMFTSGGTESINTAIFGVARKHSEHGKHIITSKVEHDAVLESVRQLEREGFEITRLPVDEQGFVSVDDVKAAIRPDTILVSIMYANNEVGTVEPIQEIGKAILKWRKEQGSAYPYFHTDACQATNYLPMHVEPLHVDLLSLNGSKIHGPKGVGVLYKKRRLKIQPLIFGGGQEMQQRGGTEDVASIVGLGKAIELIEKNREEHIISIQKLRNYFWEELKKHIDKIILNGPELDDATKRLPNNLNLSVLDIEGEALLLYLDESDIICSTGSACSSNSLEPSHVLSACGRPYEYSHGSLRFTLGKHTTRKDIDYVVKKLPEIVEKLRRISPVNLQIDPNKNTHAQIHQR
jgi:cysteine desulfurase